MITITDNMQIDTVNSKLTISHLLSVVYLSDN